MRPEITIRSNESPSSDDLKLPARLLFRFAAACRYAPRRWSRDGIDLPPEYRLPDLHSLDAGKHGFADFRMGWNEHGLLFSVGMELGGSLSVRQPRSSENSEGIDLWIDTRDVHDVHRATRYCHHFFFSISARKVAASVAPIPNARGKPKEIDGALLCALLAFESDRLRIDGFIPAAAMTGYDPVEHPRLGFNYSVRRHAWGEQTFSNASPLPFRTDPSLWGTLELLPPETSNPVRTR